MRDARALKNFGNLTSWRAWERSAFHRSGFTAISAAIIPLEFIFIFACPLFKRSPTGVEVAFGLYLLLAAGLMIFALLRLNAWKRSHPWTPPPERSATGVDGSARLSAWV